MSDEKRAGRRSGNPDTRSEILAAARALFAEQAFRQVTVRRIAERAGVDPALVHHYFGTKQDLFTAAIDLPFDPVAVIGEIAGDVPIERFGYAALGAFARVWEGPGSEELLAVMRTGLADPDRSHLLRNIFEERIAATLRPVLADRTDRFDLRCSLVASQVFGLIVTRYIARIEPLASVPAERLPALIGPTVQRYLTGELD
ncbi:TetR/AcrR family transcriptional regulator [Salininema proteolyticum]|uniref:TetR family transcriptional regulator n=1 Tax=Salininema proteolyticum TaxID=1607685 RepID=A0ABV8TUX9_9ACTN